MRKTKILVRASKETTLRSIEPTSLNTSNTLLINSLTRSKMSLDSTRDERGALALVYNVVQSVMPQPAAVGTALYFTRRNISTFLEE